MSYIKFDKYQLINLEYSLCRELLRSNRAGSYANTTIINCNTRKYHGLLITPQPTLDHGNHVLLSSVDETVIQQNSEFNLAIHKFPGNVYEPKGHKYLRDFVADPIPKLLYRVGGVLLSKEMIFSHEDRMMIRYTLLEANSPTLLRLKPFLAFRNVHRLSKENIFADKKYEKVKNGIKVKMYEGYSHLFMQISKANEYTHVPHWYYNIEYQEEMERGYEFQEDLYVPGFFEFEIKKGESVCFSAGIAEIYPPLIKRAFNIEIAKRIPRDTFEHCLINAAQQFVVKREERTEILAGFAWFGVSPRHTFISLPGLLLVPGEYDIAREVLETMIRKLDGPFFNNHVNKDELRTIEADASLWFFWALQQYAAFTNTRDTIWQNFGQYMQQILEGYRRGTSFEVRMRDDGLLSAGVPGTTVTWMNAIAYGKPVTPRTGLAVEINALWYNAICFAMEMARKQGDSAFTNEWQPVADMIPSSFMKTFWNPGKKYLADYVDGDYTDWSVRPNMVLVCSLPYSPVDEDIRKEVLARIKQELLTPRGLRTLTPKSPVYQGAYHGKSDEREQACHQGTVWPWLLGHFVDGYLRIHGRSEFNFIKSLYKGFEPVMIEHGIGTISEIYDGDPPHTPRGAISFASSVAELLRIHYIISAMESNNEE
jgi:predicted glycogen debranching enzyme